MRGDWGMMWICLVGALGVYQVLGASTASEGESESSELVKCYACGDDTIDPTADTGVEYCDSDKYDCPATTKMYNHTCDIMDRMKASDLWVRTCPQGVKSCYWAEGKYDGQVAVFRGCAEARYAHDHKCERELQAVIVTAGKKSVDVEVNLCYCNEENCNEVGSGAGSVRAGMALALAALVAVTRAFMA